MTQSRGGPIHNATIAPSAKPCAMISGWTFKWTSGVKTGRKYTMPSIVQGAATVAAQKPSTMYSPEMDRKRLLNGQTMSVSKKG